MAILTEKYVRKPLYVAAVRVTEENFNEISKWCKGEIHTADGEHIVIETSKPKKCYILVEVENPRTERQTQAHVGDWILHSDHAGYKVYNEKAFKNAFDPA